MKQIKHTFAALLMLTCVVVALAQQPKTAPKVETVKLPAERSTQLKQIVERQEALAKEFQQLESQKVIVVQRAALELHLTAEQLDLLQLDTSAEGFVLKPKPPAETAQKQPPAPTQQQPAKP